MASDLPGLFWTKLREKLSLERSFGDAQEKVQGGVDCIATAPDRSVDATVQGGAGCLSQSGHFAAEFYRWRKEYGGLELDRAKRMKDLERENVRLKRLIDRGSVA